MPKDQPGILPLVGRLIRKRLAEFRREAHTELRDGYAQFRTELEEELQDEPEAAQDDASSAGRTE